MSADITLKVLSDSLNKKVLIRLKGNKMIRGQLDGFDQHMNLILVNSEEIYEDGTSKPLGVIIIRGDNVVLISPLKESTPQ